MKVFRSSYKSVDLSDKGKEGRETQPIKHIDLLVKPSYLIRSDSALESMSFIILDRYRIIFSLKDRVFFL